MTARRAPAGPRSPSPFAGLPGPAPLGVPEAFFGERVEIPPFLLPIYQAAGLRYGVPWAVLAAINGIETAYGHNVSVSSAGARGFMQFMPATWRAFGVDANRDGVRDPDNPVDAIFSAARYLRASGAGRDLRGAIFAYNHADWYVAQVLDRAAAISRLPGPFVASVTSLAQGRFPVRARAAYGGELARAASDSGGDARAVRLTARARSTGPTRVYARAGATVVAVREGVVERVDRDPSGGRSITVRDALGTRFTYAGLGRIAALHPVVSRRDASRVARAALAGLPPRPPTVRPAPAATVLRPAAPRGKRRVFAHPLRAAPLAAGSLAQLAAVPGEVFHAPALPGMSSRHARYAPLRRGSRVMAGAALGRVGRARRPRDAHLRLAVLPAGSERPVDATALLDAWRLLEQVGMFRAGDGPYHGADGGAPTVDQMMLMPARELERRVLRDPRISIYPCGRRDIERGRIDTRVLAALEMLAGAGLGPAVSSLECGHSYRTASGNVSEHAVGSAVDIAAVGATPILGHQGPGSITETTIRRLLGSLRGRLEPHQLISLIELPGEPATMALADHRDHIHLGFRPRGGRPARPARRARPAIPPRAWPDALEQLSGIGNPPVAVRPSRFALPVRRGSAPGSDEPAWTAGRR